MMRGAARAAYCRLRDTRQQRGGTMALDGRDTSAVLDVAIALTADPVPDFVSVLDALREVIPCESASFNDMTLATRDFRYVISPASTVAMAERMKAQYDTYAHENPLIAEILASPHRGALRYRDVAGGDAVTATDFYRHFLVPLDLRYQLAMRLPSPPDVIVGYAFNRSESSGDFSDRDVAVLNTLSGHLAMHHRVSLDANRTQLFSTEMTRRAWSVVSVRSDGVIEASSSPEFEVGQQLPHPLAALVDLGTTGSPDVVRHEVALGAQRWHCVVSPLALGPTVLLLRRRHDVDISTLTDAGLTPRQAEVLIELADAGGSNRELATRLGISEGTVKKHLEAIFRLWGVSSRSAAVLMMNELTG